MKKFIIPPTKSSYSVSDGNDVLRVSLQGGFGRYRRDFCKSSATVTVSWILTGTRYKYFRSFFIGQIGRGAEAFLLDLILDDPSPLEYTVYIIPGTLTTVNPDFNIYEVHCELEVQPLVDYDNGSFAVIYTEFGDKWSVYLSMLNTEVNFTIPSILGGDTWPE